MSRATQSRSMLTSAAATLTLAIGLAMIVFAIWRWRENGWPAMVWLGAMICTMAIRAPHSARNRANVITQAQRGADEIALLLGMFITMMILPLVQLATGLFDFAAYSLPEWTTIIGAALQMPYLWLFWRSHADLGRNWSPGLEVREGHALVAEGIYARIRHPMYAAIWLSALAQPLLIPNWIAGLLVVPAFTAMWFIRVPQEEAMMRTEFGSAYDAYMARTGRLVPRA